MCRHSVFGEKRCCSVSPTTLRPTLPVHRTRCYAQLLSCKLCAESQQVQRKCNGTKAAHEIMVKLTPEGESLLIASKFFLPRLTHKKESVENLIKS